MAGIFDQSRPETDFCFDRGHNIGALVVDVDGVIQGWGVNTSFASNSSFEHAEVRAIQMATTKLNAANSTNSTGQKTPYFEMFRQCTVYTTLESCAQCSGVMALAYVKSVVFGQPDPTQNQIGNVLFAFSQQPDAQHAPLPVRGAQFLDSAMGLDKVHKNYVDAGSGQSNGIAFLNSVAAFTYFGEARHKLEAMTAQDVAPENATSLANAQVFMKSISSNQC